MSGEEIHYFPRKMPCGYAIAITKCNCFKIRKKNHKLSFRTGIRIGYVQIYILHKVSARESELATNHGVGIM